MGCERDVGEGRLDGRGEKASVQTFQTMGQIYEKWPQEMDIHGPFGNVLGEITMISVVSL
jgi:hypothetical protein